MPLKNRRFLRGKVRAIEVSITSLSLWWGIILILPFHTFSTSDSYAAMQQIAEENVWAVFMLLLGTVQLAGMVFDRFHLKRTGLLIATFIWFFIASMFAMGTPITTATGTYVIMGCLSGWLYMKVGEQFGR